MRRLLPPILVLVSLWFATPALAAPEACPANHQCVPTIIADRDCIPKTQSGCVSPNGQTGSYCCSLLTSSTPTPTTNPNAGSCEQNGNYCVPAAIECGTDRAPGQGGVCPNNGVCCGRVLPTPPPGSSGSTFVPLPPRSPIEEGFDRFDYPCPSVADPEFNPLRPYPGSPCDPLIPKSWPEKTYISFACGKSLNVENDVTIPQRRPTQDSPINPNEPYWCDSSHSTACLIRKFEYNVTIDLSGATIPILGNTQDSIDDATRVNQYLMSYLSGTVQQAEQVPLDKNDPAAISRLINFAGPLKKLLSFDSQNKIKSEFSSSDSIGKDYHNYIVGCQKGVGPQYFIDLFTTYFRNVGINITQFPGFVITSGKVILGIANLIINSPAIAQNLGAAIQAAQATDVVSAYAYFQQAVSQIPDDLLRDLADLYQYPVGYMARFGEIIQTISTDQAVLCSASDSVTTRLKDLQLPPDPNDSQFDGDFNKYWSAYEVWHGGFGIFNTPFGVVSLLDNTSVWASLFQNVPFATLEDTVSEFTVSVMNSANQQPEGVITGDASRPITLTISSGDSRITVPHVRAIDALAGLLQKIISPKEYSAGFNQSGEISSHQEVGDGPDPQHTLQVIGPGNSSVTAGNAAPFPLFTSHDSICDLKDIRINPGDYLYGQNVTAKLSYYQKFTYSPPGASTPNCTITCGAAQGECCGTGSCNLKNEDAGPQGGYYCAENDVQQTSEGRVAVFSKIPLIDQIYDKLVAGKQSVFRRFLHAQECEPNCSDEARKHYIRQDAETIPAAIGATYTGDGTVTAGDKTGGGQIYIPRLGSLFDYFLGAANENFNLQKMLRPKGFGGSGVPGLVSVPGGCQVPQTGLCSLNDPQTQLAANFPTGANTAAYICDRESAGDATAINDGCLEHPVWNTRIHSADYSVGLFQINLLSHPGRAFLNIPEGASLKMAIADIGRSGKTCYEAFSNWQDYQNSANYGNFCRVADQELLDVCVQWFQNPANAVAYARNMSGGGTNWSPWSTYPNALLCSP